ncbi:Pr6Pr family membrane protein [Micromonospora sp. RL09-050-HVF-A]|uniref:Pr6Pr family membrane protein n=1 Tax=Micromonospora sp. RL09-050-HVF-A TaxID=1703433 RepID=UPI001C5D145B|nr:Pr6Pr family membrane protein [Micromonospora sp. RL09-050-HVF-A]MBW4705827.1 Pr6Pr family membrane protein [Micromonospora sp. RL09-050-HVF-A]
MNLRRRRLAVAFRLAIVISVLAGIVLTALGPATVTGLLPYFTIQSNLAVGLFAGYAAWRAGQSRPEPPSALKGAVTLYITITGVVYHLVLANPASPFAMAQPDRGPAEAVGNQFLHTVVPLLALADWTLFDERGRLRLRYAAWWLTFPLAYLGFALVRGLIVHRYPYPFVDAGQLGYAGVTVSAVFFAVAFWLLGLLFVGVDRALARWGATSTPDRDALTPDPDAPAPDPDTPTPDRDAPAEPTPPPPVGRSA